MSRRNYLLEHLERPFTIIPPKNFILAQAVEMPELKTKGGVLMPHAGGLAESDGSSTRSVPLARVIEVGPLVGEEWGDIQNPWRAGDVVLFAPGMFPPTGLVDDLLMLNVDSIMATFVMADGDLDGRVGHWVVAESPVSTDPAPAALYSPYPPPPIEVGE